MLKELDIRRLNDPEQRRVSDNASNIGSWALWKDSYRMIGSITPEARRLIEMGLKEEIR